MASRDIKPQGQLFAVLSGHNLIVCILQLLKFVEYHSPASSVDGGKLGLRASWA